MKAYVFLFLQPALTLANVLVLADLDALAGWRAGRTWRSFSLSGKRTYRFTEMGFPADQVVDVLRHLNYRGSNKREVGEDAVIQRLCG